MSADDHERCQRDPAFLEDRKKAAGIRISPRRGDQPTPKPPKPSKQPCIQCGGGTVQKPAPFVPVKPVVTNRMGRPALGLRDQFAGQSVFLIGGGPSFANVDRSQLQRPGITLAAMNNVATLIRPHLWFSVDLPRNFSETVWRDPGVMKFTMDKHLAATRPVDAWNGEAFVNSGIKAKDCPNVWGFDHYNGWDAANFLTANSPTWGVNGASQDPDGKCMHRTVMLPSLWLLYWLGFRTVYLLGCDFTAESGRYSFDEACKPVNNELFGWLSRRFVELRPHFEQHHFRVVNCTEGSKLEAFDRLPLESAIAETLRTWPATVQTRGMYRDG